ncbi:glycoside hydrolase/phage tail family protein [Rhodobacteraceae bacterium XHP0102]|nr:glycoside hydrolase/phage tail family protein [Rhodobacteraceae bacterium XHP0102]
MATLVLSAAGAAIGSAIPGTFFGLSGATLGRAAGAMIGQRFDAPSAGVALAPVSEGRVTQFRLTNAAEGGALPRLYGQMRIGGQVIWASHFRETVTTSTQTAMAGRGKGSRGGTVTQTTTRYSYSLSVAIGICEGPILGIGRIWADGMELDPDTASYRLYKGTDDQLPDSTIEATEGAGQVPAYRGLAYVVFEDLQLAPFGNRVPQFAFEVARAAQPPAGLDAPVLNTAVQAVALIPGTGEYALSTRAVTFDEGLGRVRSANVNSTSMRPDFVTALDRLEAEYPAVSSVLLVSSWFGDDLRVGRCQIRPKVEQRDRDGREMAWRSGGITRDQAEVIARINERSVYGGTPADGAIVEAIAALKSRGIKVLHYPFLLMEILPQNDLPDPYGGSVQAAFPWRGRITTDIAPTRAGSADGTAVIADEVATFFGAAAARDFTISAGHVSYSGPNEWSYRRFILHNAAICAAAGGVEGFSIGSEMRGLTSLRDRVGFPAVAQLRALLSEVRQILPEAKLGYSADWSEYFGHQPQDGTGDVFFHLDPLWSDSALDYVGIDNYMPLADWREGADHLDAQSYDSEKNIAYLQSNIEGGEGYEWFYASAADRDAQNRTPITDGLSDKPWVFRYKDLRNWWRNPHFDRIDGVEGNALDLRGDINDATVAQNATVEDRVGFNPSGRAVARITLGIAGRVYLDRDLVVDQVYRFEALMRSGTAVTVQGALSLNDGAVKESYTLGPDWQRVVLIFTATTITNQLNICDNRAGGDAGVIEVSEIALVSEAAQTAWIPESKPIWMTEIGCPAVDKGANQPNVFLDPKSSENAVPYYSNGARDDAMQMQFLRAWFGYWLDPAKNPVSEVYDGPMIDMRYSHIWAWDTRPYPAFPQRDETWSDGENYARGHWVSGRAAAQPLSAVVAEICARAGLRDVDVSRLYDVVSGHISLEQDSARGQLQDLMQAFGITAFEREGALRFAGLPLRAKAHIREAKTALEQDQGGLTRIRDAQVGQLGRVQLGFSEPEMAYEPALIESRFAQSDPNALKQARLSLALRRGQARAIAQRWLAEARVSQDRLEFALPPSQRDLGAGDVIADEQGETWRIERVEDRGTLQIEALRVDLTLRGIVEEAEGPLRFVGTVPPMPVMPLFLDLPLLRGDENPVAPYVGAVATPWPNRVAVYSSEGGSAGNVRLDTVLDQPLILGKTETPLPFAQSGVWDRGDPLRVRFTSGALSSLDRIALLNGGNLAAIGSGDGANWQLFQFEQANLIAPNLWDLSMRLRGQAGSDGIMPALWPIGSYVALITPALSQIDLPLTARGLQRDYRIGPAARNFDDPSFVTRSLGFAGEGLRPYAPAHLRAVWSAGGWDIGFIRRTRIDGDNWQGAEVPLGETQEQYHLRIRQNGVILRDVTLSSPTYRYEGADVVAPPFEIEVAQISDSFGAGPFARKLIHDI